MKPTSSLDAKKELFPEVVLENPLELLFLQTLMHRELYVHLLLKDSKFPSYLMLNPGRTESEGTSVTKVCPYTYCSLNGHGSHTLSIAGGNFVANVNILENDKGTAKGGSPRAHVVAYKACWNELEAGGCYETDMMEAFDQAILDGVDLISISLGDSPSIADEMFTDGVSIRAFHAIARNIRVVAAAVNRRPELKTVSNVVPWPFTVAASTMDRLISSNVAFGSTNQTVKGASLNTGPTPRYYSSISREDARLPNASRQAARYCRSGTLDPNKVRGKVLICSRDPSITSAAEGQEAVRADARELLFEMIQGPVEEQQHMVQMAFCMQFTACSGGHVAVKQKESR